MTNALSTERQNALPDEWVDRLFQRFAVMYGKHWLDLWSDVPAADMRDAWATGLAQFTGQRIAAALNLCGKFPPTLPEFVQLCADATVPAAHQPLPALPHKRETKLPDSVRQAFEQVKQWNGKRKGDGRDWAREIVALHAAGQYRHHYGLELAREALADIGEAA